MFLLTVINWTNITNNFPKYGKITSKEKLPKRYSLGSFSGCLHKKTSETVKHQQIRPRNLSGCCLHGVCTSGICFAETLLAEAGVEKTPSQWNGVLVPKRRSLVSKKGKNTSQTGKQFRKYFYCFCLAEALLAEAETEKTPNNSLMRTTFQQLAYLSNSRISHQSDCHYLMLYQSLIS